MLNKYSELLVSYCLRVSPGDKVLIRTTLLAEPLVRLLYADILSAGGICEVQFAFKGQEALFLEHASPSVLGQTSAFYEQAVSSFQCVLTIMAPYDMYETAGMDADRKKQHQLGLSGVRQLFSQRAARGDLRWSLCVYPTEAAATACGMTLSDYTTFVYEACKLTVADPAAAWQALGGFQSQIVSYLNAKQTIRFLNDRMDITFSTLDRTWINSDGKRNMPSGEVFTSPVEDSASGYVYFSCPTIYDHQDVHGVRLEVQDGYITAWTAETGQAVLDRVFQIEGARRFGEIAIGTNASIQQITKNILFDEKIAGTIHMAVGNSYPETGGKNQSVVHWDLITDMTHGGQCFADGECFYKDGSFLPFVVQ